MCHAGLARTGEAGVHDGTCAAGNRLGKRHRGEIAIKQLLSAPPNGIVSAGNGARARSPIRTSRSATRNRKRALHGLNDIEQGNVRWISDETHATVRAADALYDAGLNEVALNRAREGVRHVVLLCRGTNGNDPGRLADKLREHAQGVIRLSRDIQGYLQFRLCQSRFLAMRESVVPGQTA